MGEDVVSEIANNRHCDCRLLIDIPRASPYCLNTEATMKRQIKAAAMRVAVLESELQTCTTVAMRKCVSESLEDARRQLRALGR
jgi:hypothetical protein